MVSLLNKDALKNIWCEPSQDYQHYFKPARLTRAGGTTKYVSINGERVGLPNVDNILDKRIFHVYHLGRRFDTDFNFTIAKSQWVSLDIVANSNNIVFDIFFSNGSKYPLNKCLLKRLDNDDIILSVEVTPIDLGIEIFTDEINNVTGTRVVNLENSALYIRTYANARYDSLDWLAIEGVKDRSIVYFSIKIATQNDYVSFMAQANAIENLYTFGRGLYYSEGFLVSKPIGYTASYIGKTLTFYFDQSIKKIETFSINALPFFTSTLDNGVLKYGVVRQPPYDMIDYHDDIDFYITDITTGSAYKGVLIPKLFNKDVRQLTHTAYALRKDVIGDLIDTHSFLSPNSKLMLVIREGGMKRGLTPQHLRLTDLYKLNYTDIVTAMQSNTTIPEWLFPNLENSSYNEIMRYADSDLPSELVEDAYGYNTALKTTSNLLIKTRLQGGRYFFTVPENTNITDSVTTSGKRLIFTYREGVLINWFVDNTLFEELVVPVSHGVVDMVEVFNYDPSTTTDGNIYDQDVNHRYLKQYGFRAYVSPMIGGAPTEDWEDVTGTGYYEYDPIGDVSNGFTPRVVWNWGLLTQGTLYPCIRMNSNMFIKTVNGFGSGYLGYIQLTMNSMNTWLGSTQLTPQHISPGTIDVFMDGSPLVENVDYYVRWPKITVVKRPLSNPLTTQVIVRCYGVCNPITMKHYGPRETGFAKGGILSINNRYDIRNDRVIRVIADGKLRHPDEVSFGEETPNALIRDGKPYAINDYILPVESFTTQSLIPYRNRSVDLDERVMDYLTERLPTTTISHPYVSEWRWSVVSPFCSAIIHALQSGFLNTGVLDNPYTKTDTDNWLVSYLPLLEVDPCVVGVDGNYIAISPHQYENYLALNASQYRFIEFIVSTYLNNKVDPTLSIYVG